MLRPLRQMSRIDRVLEVEFQKPNRLRVFQIYSSTGGSFVQNVKNKAAIPSQSFLVIGDQL